MGQSDLWKTHQTCFYVFKNVEYICSSNFGNCIKVNTTNKNNIGSDDACDVLKLGIQSTMNENEIVIVWNYGH